MQQDPREKLDVFENLGYYLIVFRAIDETYFKYTAPDVGASLMKPGGFLPTSKRNAKSTSSSKSGRKKGKLEIVEDNPGKEGLEGVGVGGINIYLVVFADGIVSVSLASSACNFSKRKFTVNDHSSMSQFHFGDISKHIDRVREKISTVDKESTNAGESCLEPCSTTTAHSDCGRRMDRTRADGFGRRHFLSTHRPY